MLICFSSTIGWMRDAARRTCYCRLCSLNPALRRPWHVAGRLTFTLTWCLGIPLRTGDWIGWMRFRQLHGRSAVYPHIRVGAACFGNNGIVLRRNMRFAGSNALTVAMFTSLRCWIGRLPPDSGANLIFISPIQRTSRMLLQRFLFGLKGHWPGRRRDARNHRTRNHARRRHNRRTISIGAEHTLPPGSDLRTDGDWCTPQLPRRYLDRSARYRL